MYKKKIDFNSEDYASFSISELKRIADYWLRQSLLKEYSDYIFCPLKKRKFHKSNMEVAHFIDRANMWTRYNLANCHLVSKQSNTWDAQVQVEGYKSLHHKEYEEYLIKEYGENIIEALRGISEIKTIFARQDYIDAIKRFKK